MRYEATIHLSNDFRRTCMFVGGDTAEAAALDGCYDGAGVTLVLDEPSLHQALDVVYAIANSYPSELHCSEIYSDHVRSYRAAGKRSLSVGDLVVIRGLYSPSHEDGRYVVASIGFERVEASVNV